MIQSKAFLRLLQAGFWAALVFTLFSAFAPVRHVENLLPWDKAQHFLAFYVLSVLGAAAFPKRSLIVIGSVLSGVGAVIELVQATPLVARDAEVFDWVADTVAIVAALGPVLLMQWRARVQRE
jgi:VanZ family protein